MEASAVLAEGLPFFLGGKLHGSKTVRLREEVRFDQFNLV